MSRRLELLCACAGSIVARQSFLPGIDLKGATLRARWEPVFAGADAQRLARFAAAMPHACRALTGTEDTSPPDTQARTVLFEFSTEIVDGLIRSVSAPDRLSSVPASELARLAEQVREWQRPVAAQATTPFRLCFRLEPEERGEDGEPVQIQEDERCDQSRWGMMA